MPRREKFILFFVLIGVPLSFVTFPFFGGFCNWSQGCIMLLVPWILLGPALSGTTAATSIPNISRWKKGLIGVGTAIGTFILSLGLFFGFGAGARIWTFGFSTNFILTKHPDQIQQWATKVLDEYESGTLETNTNVEYWAVGRAKLKDSEIPSQIGDLWWNKPSIGIATITDNGWFMDSIRSNTVVMPELTGGQAVPLHLSHCVAFSWYETGFLVGRPDFQSKWNPWYLRELYPGIYVFCGEK